MYQDLLMKRKYKPHGNLEWQAKTGFILFVIALIVALDLKIFGIEVG